MNKPIGPFTQPRFSALFRKKLKASTDKEKLLKEAGYHWEAQKEHMKTCNGCAYCD